MSTIPGFITPRSGKIGVPTMSYAFNAASYERELQRKKNRTVHVPSLASREAAKISADDIIDAAFFLRRNGRVLHCDAKKYGHDCWRLFGPVVGVDVYNEVCGAAGFDDDEFYSETDLDAEWLSFNRERNSTDSFLIDFCEEVYRRRDELIDPDDENPEPLKLSVALMAELDRAIQRQGNRRRGRRGQSRM
jgi:hypothetical protein